MENAMIEEVKDQIVDLLGCDRDEIVEASAKVGFGIDVILETIVRNDPSAYGRPGCTAAGADLRLCLQLLSRHHCLFPDD